MDSISDYLRQQYALVKDSRKVLFAYCKTIDRAHFLDQNTSFGRGGSMRNLLVHIATTYQYWIVNSSLKKGIPYAEYCHYDTVEEVIGLFATLDAHMEEFLAGLDPEKEIAYEMDGETRYVKAFQIFSHVITHEFHHKGQVLSLSRHLGYVPVDTDIMR